LETNFVQLTNLTIKAKQKSQQWRFALMMLQFLVILI
ncbi:hypothetical protein T08_1688, partial [Trichinella sp. T8]